MYRITATLQMTAKTICWILLVSAIVFSIATASFAAGQISDTADVQLDLTTVHAASGGYTVEHSVAVGGQVFPIAMNVGTWDVKPKDVVFANTDGYVRFSAWIGFLDNSGQGSVQFKVLGNGRILFSSDQFSLGHAPQKIDVDISGCSGVTLLVSGTPGTSTDAPIWANPEFSRVPVLTKTSVPAVRPATQSPTPNISASQTDITFGTKLLAIPPDKMDELASKLKAASSSRAQIGPKTRTLAVALFDLVPANDLAPANATNIREDLSTSLFNTGLFDIVERSQLNKALAEMKMGLSDTFDSTTAQQLGKLVGAQAIVIGSISDRGPFTVINARLISTETGQVEAAANIEVSN